MKWIALHDAQTLEKLREESYKQPVLVFKHSTRCPVSSMALSWFERSWNAEEMQAVQPYFLDLINYRPISNQIAEEFNVQHESPQLLLIKNGECTYHRSHHNISYKDLLAKI